MFVFLFYMFFFKFCVLCVLVLFCVLFLSLCMVVYFLFVYSFTDHCHWVESQLQLINIISYMYLIISYHIVLKWLTLIYQRKVSGKVCSLVYGTVVTLNL